ncbi:hypothetical protein ACFWAR_02695 [Streptomyces sp. NPDC059917]|uniref:hypothetical protein n=1 Tax=Streptomyces sp. NPDC059917 TaxID=3347002 RepID=UPI00364BBFA0
MDTDHGTAAEFARFYRTHTARLVAFLLVRGAAPDAAARLAQDAMAAAGEWTAVDAAAPEPPDGPAPGRDRAGELRAWTHRVALAGLERPAPPDPAGAAGSAPPAGGPMAPAAREAAAHGGWRALADRLAGLEPRRRRVIALTTVGCAPGAIGYELLLPTGKVHRTLRSVARLLGEPTEDALTARLAAALDELAAALDGVLDLDAGLAELAGRGGAGFPGAWGLDPRLPVPRWAAPAPPAPAPTRAPGPGREVEAPLRAYAARLAGCDGAHRAAVRGHLPAAELAAVRLGALFAFHTDRFRKDAEASWYRDSGVDFPAVDARAFADALTRDVTRARAAFDAVSGPGAAAPRRAGGLASWLAHDEPGSIEVSYGGIELAVALAEFRAGALAGALRTLSPSGAPDDGALYRALARVEPPVRLSIGRLRHLEADLSLAESTLPEGYYVDMTRDFAADDALNQDLIHGLDAIERTLAEAAPDDREAPAAQGDPRPGRRGGGRT